MKEVKPDLREGMTLEQAKAYKTTKVVTKVFKWAVITSMVVSAALFTRWLILVTQSPIGKFIP